MPLPVILIFVHKISSINLLLKELFKLNYTKIIQIDNFDNKKVQSYHHRQWWKLKELSLFLISILIFLGLISFFSPLHSILIALAFLAFSTALLFLMKRSGLVKDPLVKRYGPLLLAQETLVVVECTPQELSKFINHIQKFQEEPLAFFVIYDEQPLETIRSKETLPQIPLSSSEIEKQAQGLAHMQQSISYKINFSRLFLSRVHYLSTKYQSTYQKLSDFALYNKNIHLSAEWLLENSFTVKQGISDIRKNLPEKFFKELPFINAGPNLGLPTLYLVVARLVATTDGKVTAQNILEFLNAYQSITPLTMGELWAFPLLLKIRLIECLVVLTKNNLDRVCENQLADLWANRIMYALKRDPEHIYAILALLSKEVPKPSPFFADQLMIQLEDSDSAATMAIKGWLQKKVGEDLSEIFHYEQSRQTVEQTSLANIITSLRRLEQLNWRDVFEEASIVDRILAADPAGLYTQQDFNTRDRYRHILEKLARGKGIPEVKVAEAVVNLSKAGTDALTSHCGYYLIDEGLPTLEKAIDYKPSTLAQLSRKLWHYRPAMYVTAIGLLTLAFAFAFVSLIGIHSWSLVLGLLSLFPFSELALQIVNCLASHLLPPHILPKMSFENGVPANCRTLTVIPTLLADESAVQREVEKLEIHYLANAHEEIVFALLTDFKDSQEESNNEDAKILDLAEEAIRHLNEKYSGHHFYLFHRPRKFNPAENCWMGWERKRGKLEQMNCYLNGDDLSELDNFLRQGDATGLTNVRYVVTVDSDTQLPKESIRELIETISHPLNAAIIDKATKKVLRGYTIIQPRVSTHYLSGKSTWFSRLFSDPFGIDPYSQSISDVYQDLFHEGVYHGKGIYDWKAFHEVLSGRFPENAILSHDLIEGAYVKTAFASDIELHDTFPENYALYSKRQHRWIRGDWQIIDWLKGKVKNFQGQYEKNPLDLANRWKVFDNLRRSLLPLASIIILLVSWFTSASFWWTGVVLLTLALPSLLQGFDYLYVSITTITLSEAWRNLGKELMRSIVHLIFLPHLAWSSVDAIIRTIYRKIISGQNLLQWQVSSAYNKSDFQNCQNQLTTIAFLALIAGILLAFYAPISLIVAGPILLAWFVSPFVNIMLERRYQLTCEANLTTFSQQYLRVLARKTWKYFDDFVTAEAHWMPPDNYQEKVKIEVAYRTSPTNIGLYLTSTVSARCMGYITIQNSIQRLHDTIKELDGLERYEGHFLNWYDIKSTAPLSPRYVSTVDSGNLLAAFWGLEEECKELADAPIINPKALLDGMNDSFQLLLDGHSPREVKEFAPSFSMILQKLQSKRLWPKEFKSGLDQLESVLSPAIEQWKSVQLVSQNVIYWAEKISQQIASIKQWMDQTLSWSEMLENPLAQKILVQHPEAISWKIAATKEFPSIREMHTRNWPGLISLVGWLQTLPLDKFDSDTNAWTRKFLEAVNQSFEYIDNVMTTLEDVQKLIQSMGNSLNMAFLYNEERQLFSIGYNVSEHRLDSSCYDLLASEARLASLIAIARGDVPLEHWWALGRPVSEGFGMPVLQSWGGTMFEYLMPVIWCRNYENTLLDYACKAAVRCQIAYGNQLGIPWGISESAYSRLDMHNIYQYRAFGVPQLGLKFGLEKDFVITPYSSALALMIDPQASVKNLKRLEDKEKMDGPYGLYEAIDYSREYKPVSQRGIIIHAYMAHHMGMTLSAICNTLCNAHIQQQFHVHPRVKAIESLLFERPSISHSKILSRGKDRSIQKLFATHASSGISRFDTPFTPIPMTNLLSNGRYSVMITNSGGGFSRYQNLDITRWQADVTCDNWGSFIYIRDLERNAVFSNTFHPINSAPTSYHVNFFNHKVEILKKDQGFNVFTEIVVSPEDDVEIRCLTIANHSMRRRTLELTSYLELAMASHAADLAHPAFSKMFIETEIIREKAGLLAQRRKRSPDDKECFSLHVAAISSEYDPEKIETSFETSRERFIGRGQTLASPLAIKGALSNTAGCVLDPIFSIRKKVQLDPGKEIKISFVTGYAETREHALKLIEKYRHFDASTRAIDMSWTYAELDLRRLHITHEDAKLFQRLANSMIFPDIQLRASNERIKRNRLDQEKLWCFGISGDNPILLVTIEDPYNLDVVHNALAAHAFWHMRGFKTDIVVLNAEKTSYEMTLNEHLVRVIQNYAQYTGININGGIFLLGMDQLPREEQDLLFAVAHAVIVAERGSISQQLAVPRRKPPTPTSLQENPRFKEEPSPSLPFLELSYFNGIGGFTKDGKEYAIYLDNQKFPAAPWTNVIANSNFGFLATETGLGVTWAGNSQQNRLTTWSNDPTVNPISDVCYIRDDDSNKFWSITASPINERDPFRTRHGHGYTIYEHNSHAIEQEMTVFSPLDDQHSPVRIQIIKLTNRSSQKRRLSVFAYMDLTLGQVRESSQRYVITSWNYESNSLIAYNHYRKSFGDRIVFLSSSPSAVSYIGNRKTFIGRNHNLANPDALKFTQLPPLTGPSHDPCFSLQVPVELFSGETAEVVFIFGEAPHIAKSREIIKYYQNYENVKNALQSTKMWWEDFLSKINISTPDSSFDLLFNRWLPYQNQACRIWGRTAFYQSGGAFGFRDQLQDSAAIVYMDPQFTRQHIIRCASRQFVEGDVQHWWHPETGSGVRTRISDDLLWLPYVALHYTYITGDTSVWEEQVPYLEGRLLAEDEHEAFIPITATSYTGSIKEHCLKAIEKAMNFGPHGLPLIGGGDWNDGMNHVGTKGQGESVWLAWFLIYLLKEFSTFLKSQNDPKVSEQFSARASALLQAVETHAWDGAWYIRAFFDSGAPIGSHLNVEDQIDSLSQSWAVFNGLDNERTALAMQSVEERLVDEVNRIVMLFTPPYDQSNDDPGYIKGYPPGVRENGGQYTHAALWVASAFAKRGEGDKAFKILQMSNPVTRTSTAADREKYRVEPYVTAADIYALKGDVGRGGWTWYTGSASVMYRVMLEDICGFKLRADRFELDPVIPCAWDGFKLSYRYQETSYRITIENPAHVSRGVMRVELNGNELTDKIVVMTNDHQDHEVRVILGKG